MYKMQMDYVNQSSGQEKDITQDPEYRALEARSEQIDKELQELDK